MSERLPTPTAVVRRRSARLPSSTTATGRATPRHSSPDWSQTILESWTWEPGRAASAQLREAGARVLAVEPHSRMARVAAGKGIAVEQATFEGWHAAGRLFDLVVFAQSFHWVQPRVALEKVATILSPHGRLALLSNRITPLSPTPQDFEEAYSSYLDATLRPSIDAAHDDDLTSMIEECCGHGSRSASARPVSTRETMPWRSLVRPTGNTSS